MSAEPRRMKLESLKWPAHSSAHLQRLVRQQSGSTRCSAEASVAPFACRSAAKSNRQWNAFLAPCTRSSLSRSFHRMLLLPAKTGTMRRTVASPCTPVFFLLPQISQRACPSLCRSSAANLHTAKTRHTSTPNPSAKKSKI